MYLRYAAGNIWARWRTVLPMLLAISAAVTTTVVIRAVLDSLYRSVLNEADDTTGVIVSRDAQLEQLSTMPATLLGRIDVAPGIANDQGKAVTSPEVIDLVPVKSPTGEPSFMSIRGVDQAAFRVHPEVEVIRGRAFQRGEEGVLLGARQLGRFQGFEEGGSIEIGKRRWPVVGVFRAAESSYESEIWVDRTLLMAELHREDINTVVVTLADKSQAPSALASAMQQIRDVPVEGLRASSFRRRSLVQFGEYQAASALVVLLLFLGSLFACTSAMYTALLGRQRELATLMAIGYTRLRIALLLLVESSLLSLIGGAVGIAAALGFHGMTINHSDALIYSVHVTLPVILSGLRMAVAIGIIAGFVAVIQGSRMTILASLRGS